MAHKVALIQYASGPEHAELLDLTRRYHHSYCEDIEADYLVEHSDIADDRPKHWRKIKLIEDALDKGYEKIVWLDCDAIIVNRDVNLFELSNFGIAVCECYDSPSVVRHLNTGVIWAVRSPEVMNFVHEWDRTPRNSENGWQDQNAFIQLMAKRPHRDILSVLPNRFNCIETHMEARDPVIRHFAGDGDRLAKMAKLMRDLQSDGHEDARQSKGSWLSFFGR